MGRAVLLPWPAPGGPMRRLLLALLLVAGATGTAKAVDQGGSIELWGDAYDAGDPEFQGWIRETYTLDAQPERWFFLKLAVMLDHDSHGDVERDRLYDDTDRGLKRAPLRFRDLAMGFRAGETTIVVGRQRLTWKRASFVNATDNLTPRDWTDPLDEARLSPWAADATWEHERWSVEAALVPRYAPSRLPQLNGRWFETPEVPVQLSWGDAAFPPLTWDTLQGAVRGGYRGARGEVRLSYYRGFDDAPRITPVGATLDRSFAKLEVAGIDGEVLAGPFVFRGEGGYFHFPDGVDDGYGLFQVEGEWSRSGWRVIAGYGDVVGGGASAAAPAPASLDQAFLPAVFLDVEKGEATEWQVALDATVGTKAHDSLVRVSGSCPFAGHVRAGGELDLVSGAAGTFWGRWRDNDRLRVFLRFDF
jgi:hypothetical protein